MPAEPSPSPPASDASPCCGGSPCCGPEASAPAARIVRRDFLKLGSAAVAGAAVGGWPPRGAIAGPFAAADLENHPIPADKKFDRAWVASLAARGEPTVYRAAAGELRYIGMPIGGICCGQVYLGGDGRLWHWDIFNLPQSRDWSNTAGPHYAQPPEPASPLEQGFALRVSAGGEPQVRRLDATGFRDVAFRGEYPIGRVDYADPECPLRVQLEAFSPFCPLDEALSGTPAIVLNYTLTNASNAAVTAEIAGWLQNIVCAGSGKSEAGARVSRVVREKRGDRSVATIEHTARAPRAAERPAPPARPDVVFEDWEHGTYDGWNVTGTAFGERPRNLDDIAGYQGELNAQGRWTVNTHETRGGEDVVKADTHIGTLTSRVFLIERDYVSFRIGGGNHAAQTCVNLLIDGAVVRTATGQSNNRMRIENFDVREFAGREAQIQIVDGWTGGWGQVGCDEIVFCDQPRREPYDMERAPDYGAMSLSVLGAADATARAAVDAAALPQSCFEAGGELGAETPLHGPGVVSAVRSAALTLEPGATRIVTFLLAWHFPNPDRAQLSFLTDAKTLRRWYAGVYPSAEAVRLSLIEKLDERSAVTRRWRDTWYDSTLPYWFLDRAFATVTTAATATCWRFDNGRFYGWEGTYCCAGTCTHVWQYAQALARVFPALERTTREMVDFGLAFNDDSGQIDYRGEAARHLAVDGQCGTILRAYREHQMSVDDRFLRTVWPRVKKATALMLDRDTNADGLLDGEQYNTLDTSWYGQIAWLSSLYLAAVRAAQAMAGEMGDAAFEQRCADVVRRGATNMVERLFNGEYFIHIPDPAHPETNSTGDGCHADQLLGQAWAHQVGLGRIVPLGPSRSALRALYRYSFTPDIGPYRKLAEQTIKGGRWYAMPGEGGLLVCTWPKGGLEAAVGKGRDAWAASYFNECWTGFEHQVAAHMIWEGLIEEGLAITRMLHDRHHAARRNPWNEVECSSHYARAMAGYGSFIAATGFEHHGPRGTLAFAPRLTPDAFRSAFICAGGWGQYRQQREPGVQRGEIEVRWGKLRVTELAFDVAERLAVRAAEVRLSDAPVPCELTQEGTRVKLTLRDAASVAAGQTLRVTLTG